MTDRETKALEDLREEVERQRDDFAAHERADHDRHEAVMGLLAEVRDGQRRTVGHWLYEAGADAVPVPLTGGGSIRLRTLAGLVVLLVGALLSLGIGGETVAGWVDSYLGSDASAAAEQLEGPEPTGAEPAAPTDPASSPAPLP